VRSKLAATYNVSVNGIRLILNTGSVVLGVRITFPSVAAAQQGVSTIEAATPTRMSTDLGLDVESVTTPRILTVAFEAPSPPPPSQPSPPQKPPLTPPTTDGSVIGVVVALMGSVLLSFLLCATCVGVVVAKPDGYLDEPPRHKKSEHRKWQEECDRRKRLSTAPPLLLGPGTKNARGVDEAQELLS